MFLFPGLYICKGFDFVGFVSLFDLITIMVVGLLSLNRVLEEKYVFDGCISTRGT